MQTLKLDAKATRTEFRMIDEELYQKAADELNSDKRRSDVWARACVLSKNDHDEARYLYTNLRVEELLAEREGGIGETEDLNITQHDETISLDLTGAIEESTVHLGNEAGDFTADNTLSISEMNTVRSDKTSGTQSDFLDDTLSTLDTTLNSTSQRIAFEKRFVGHDLGGDQEVDDTHISAIEREYYAQNPNQLNDRARESTQSTVEKNNEQLDVLLDGVNPSAEGFSALDDYDNGEHALTADFTDAPELQSIVIDEELEWLDGQATSDTSGSSLQRVPAATSASLSQSETDRLTQELLRQADELPGQHSDVVSSTELEESTWEPSAKANVAAVGTAAAIGAARYGDHQGSQSGSRNSQATFADTNRQNSYPVDLTQNGSGKKYSVFKRNSKVQAVKKGVSWSALFFTLPYLIYRHMVGTAIVYTLMAIIIGAGLFVSGMAWLDAGAAASDLIKLCTVGFALLAFIGLIYLPFRHANQWRSNKLEKRGFELTANVRASNPGKAISAARRASALD